MTKSNKELKLVRDPDKSYTYVEYKGKMIGMFSWDYKAKNWRYTEYDRI